MLIRPYSISFDINPNSYYTDSTLREESVLIQNLRKMSFPRRRESIFNFKMDPRLRGDDIEN